MNAIDYPGLLAQLEQQDRALVQEREDLAVIIAAVRKRAGVVVPIGLALPPARNGGGKNGHTRKSGGAVRLSPDKLTAIRTQYEAGISASKIEKNTGVSMKTIYKRAKEGGWKRGVPAAATKPAPAETPKGHQLSGSVKCDKCGSWTDFDPCRSCGKPLERKW